MNKALTPAMEDYLELILKLKQEKTVVRVRDIAKGMKVKMPSVTSMLNTLPKKDLIHHEKYEYVDLTARGLKKAKEAQHKHSILFNFLKDVLKVNPRQADIDACGMEHAVSPATLKKLVDFIDFIEFCPRAGFDWLEHFSTYCEGGRSREKCEQNMIKFLKNYPGRVEDLDNGNKVRGKRVPAETGKR
jgi:DtxR family Mn-dependent transcriptional regulator